MFFSGLAIALTAGFGYYKINYKDAVVVKPSFEITTHKLSVFSLENAPSESLKGEITTMSGEIDWQSRTATQASKIESPIPIGQGESLITGANSRLTLEFENTCTVNLNENTETDIIQTLPANIVFSQTGGSGEYIKTGNYPVSVRLKNLLVNPDGDMTVTYDLKKPLISVILKSGTAVLAFNDLKYNSHEVQLNHGETYVFNYGTRKGVLK
jgi:hypothetical protein